MVVDDKTLLSKIRGHGCARIWRWMLDIRPIDIAARKFEICFNGFRRIVRVSDDQTADDEHFVFADVMDGLQGCIAHDASMAALFILGSGAEKSQVVIEDVFDSEEDVPEASPAHQYRQLFTVVGDARSHRLDDVVNAVQLCLNDPPAQGFESLDIQSDVVINQEDCSCATVIR